MKERFMDALTYSLIDRNNFMPLSSEEGQMFIYSPLRILESSAYGGLTLIEIIDGDAFDADAIVERLRANSERLDIIKGRQPVYCLEVFVFHSTPDAEKLQAISSGNRQKAWDKRYVACTTIALSSGEVSKHSDILKPDKALDKSINEVLAEDIEGAADYNIQALVESKKKEYTIEFASKVPILTYALIATNIAVWLFIHAVSIMKGIDYGTLIMSFGAKENLQIMQGEYWRLVTPIFLHANIMHLAINCYSLYQLGILVERMYGNAKFCFVYFTAGIIGNIVSFMVSPNAAVGASGAIFGLMGALLYFGIENPKQFKRYFGSSIVVTLIINISYGLSPGAGIDNSAHMGGLIGGFLAAGIVQLKGAVSKFLRRPVFITVTVIVVALSLYYGFTNSQNVLALKIDSLEKLSDTQKWSEAEKLGVQILDKNPKDKDIRLRTYWTLAVADLYQGKVDKAFEYAGKVKELDSAKGSYLAGAMYFDTKQYSLAKQELQHAKELDSSLGDAVDKLLAELANLPQ